MMIVEQLMPMRWSANYHRKILNICYKVKLLLHRNVPFKSVRRRAPMMCLALRPLISAARESYCAMLRVQRLCRRYKLWPRV